MSKLMWLGLNYRTFNGLFEQDNIKMEIDTSEIDGATGVLFVFDNEEKARAYSDEVVSIAIKGE